jgi:hypothetical protein
LWTALRNVSYSSSDCSWSREELFKANQVLFFISVLFFQRDLNLSVGYECVIDLAVVNTVCVSAEYCIQIC